MALSKRGLLDNPPHIHPGISYVDLQDPADYRAVVNVCAATFQAVMPTINVASVIDAASPVRDLSIGVKVNDTIIGGYIFGCGQISEPLFKGLKGLEGIALALTPGYRNLGIGRILRAAPSKIEGIDYVWGGQHRNLNNIKDWRKHRILYSASYSNYVTVEALNEPLKTQLLERENKYFTEVNDPKNPNEARLFYINPASRTANSL